MLRNLLTAAVLGGALMTLTATAQAEQDGSRSDERSSSGARPMDVVVPAMRSDRGRKLFASKGCVICHSVNGVGGTHTPALDAEAMQLPMNPFEFAARMWRGADAMIALQRGDLGGPIRLTGQELADIAAFVHDEREQKKFSEADIPQRILDLISEVHGDAEEN